MKKFKKLIPALCMLLVSAVMLGSSTFAWFSMNNKVTATGMEVTAKANTQYFVISDDNTSFANDKTSLAFTKKTEVYPVSYLKDAAAANALITKIASGTYAGTTTAPKAGDWYTANSMTYDNAVSDKLANVKNVAFGATDYFVQYTFYVGLAANSSDFTGTFTISVENKNVPKEAVNAVVVITGKSSSTADEATTTVTTDLLTEAVTTGNYFMSATSSTYVTVKVYVYVDGTHANVKDSEKGNITGKFDIVIEGTNA